MKRQFIKATNQACSFDNPVHAPCFRRAFRLDFMPEEAEITICGLGFYRLFVNGREITKGALAPYISNPDHIAYVDVYPAAELLNAGENVIGVILGNGFYTNLGGVEWNFDTEPWCGAPRLALEFTARAAEKSLSFSADARFLVHPSPITFDDLRMGEWYDARLEMPGWNAPGFDDGNWENALPAEPPRGELRLCEAEPIRVERRITPVSVTRQEEGFLYDFGENIAGVTRLRLRAEPGQRISVRHGECLENGHFSNRALCYDRPNTQFYKEYFQRTVYTAKGEGMEEYAPSFTYYGFCYALVEGITKEQATKELLTCEVMHSDLKRIGGFSCSDPTANTLMEMAVRTDLANFFYFPTDCPHREKNGWTGDAQISAAHLTYLFDAEKSYTEWLRNIRKSQKEWGELPGIVPTGSWGYAWGNGPAWDAVLFALPWQLYRKRGNRAVIRENAQAMVRYLSYLMTRRSGDGTIGIGLGDWVPVGKPATEYETPESVTSTLYAMVMAGAAEEMLTAIGEIRQAQFARGIRLELLDTLRRVWLDQDTMAIRCRTQTAQAMALYFGVFRQEEEERAFRVLMELIRGKDGNFDCGMLGLYALFHVLAKYGEAELAWHMITKPEFPSFGYLVQIGETTFPEALYPKNNSEGYPTSHNHHLFCNIARFFLEDIAGLKITGERSLTVAPHFIGSLTWAEAEHWLPAGRVFVRWQREDGQIRLTVKCPAAVCCTLNLPPVGEKVETVIEEEPYVSV